MMVKDFFDNLYYCRYRPYERKFTPTPAQLEIESKIQSDGTRYRQPPRPYLQIKFAVQY